MSTVINTTFHRSQRGGRVVFGDEPVPASRPKPEPERRPARVAVMLALAHKIRWAIDEGRIANHAEAARRLGFSRARVSQLLALTLLPVAEQERILFLEAVGGREPGSERGVRATAVDARLSREAGGGRHRRLIGRSRRAQGEGGEGAEFSP